MSDIAKEAVQTLPDIVNLCPQRGTIVTTSDVLDVLDRAFPRSPQRERYVNQTVAELIAADLNTRRARAISVDQCP
ncbi:hypothetical protein ACPA54_30080 [Uniformispora flossi]|uniref:hypothetical protein n=1 Tax=Uniformispora flossi TaxID=3390723 RepID=UPI003C300770